MVFASTVFLFIFLPAVWALYSVVPNRFTGIKNGVLALASLVFYAYGEPIYVFLILSSVAVNYYLARIIARDKSSDASRRLFLILCIVFNLGILGFFKYVPWLMQTVNSAFSVSLPIPSIKMPIGISFYTFQILSYAVDVYRKKIPAQKNFVYLFLYISFFPQFIAGPIVKYSDIEEQISHRTVTAEKTAGGIRRFIIGLSKKVLVSNTAAVIADAAFSSALPSTGLAWAGALCYCIQIYYDFSGYSDMAIGLAKMFGFDICENFSYPYSAVSIRDFWKRWHISLTSWFREYVYIPLGGNRISSARTVLNRYIVFFLTGLWHGANVTFILWGLWHGTLMMLEKLVHMEKLTRIKALKPVCHVYTLLCVCLGFVLFRAPSLGSALSYIRCMFTNTAVSAGADLLPMLPPYTVFILIASLFFAVPLVPFLRRLSEKTIGKGATEVLGYAVCIPAFVLSVMTLASSSFNPFIYYIF